MANADLSSLTNPLVTPDQLTSTSSRLDGLSPSLESSCRFAGARLTQAAGVLLKLPQELIAQAIVIFYRFFTGAEAGSFRVNSVKDASLACLYLTTKPSSHPQKTRTILNVYAYLVSPVSPLRDPSPPTDPDPDLYLVSEGDYQTQRHTLYQTESIILRAISFTTHVVTPHHLALTYLQTLGVLPSQPTDQTRALSERVIKLLNTALLSPQMLYLTHQPPSLAVAAIYLAAREVGMKLSSQEWWEIFDVEREELGFLVVGMLSCEGFVQAEKEKWSGGSGPLTLQEVENAMKSEDEGE